MVGSYDQFGFNTFRWLLFRMNIPVLQRQMYRYCWPLNFIEMRYAIQKNP